MTDQKVVVITGAGRGIGNTIAKILGQQKYALALIDIMEKDLNHTASQLSRQGVDVYSVIGDISSETSVKECIKKIQDHYQHIDILVNNAGITSDTLCVRMKLEDWRSVIDINLTGTFLISKEVVKGMMKRRWGRIVTISSVVASIGNAGQVNYSASKAGLLGLTRSLARETATREITVNAVSPGFIDTDMTRTLPDNVKEQLLQSIPLKRYGKPEDVAHAVRFLISEKASYITGQVIHVNGGLFM